MAKLAIGNILLMLILCSCAQRIKVPINRMMTPETLGGGAGVEYQQLGFSSGKLDFSDNKTNNALVMGSVTEENFHIDIGPVDRMDLFVDVPKESSSKVGVKIQILGEPEKKKAEGHQLAFSLATGSSQDSFEQGYKIKLRSTLQDYSIMHGYRLNPNVMLYDGLSLTSYSFRGDIEEQDNLKNDYFEYSADKILGLFGGVAFGTEGLKLKAEIAAQQIEWSHTSSKIFYSFGYSLMAYW